MTDQSETNIDAHVVVRFMLPVLPGTRLVQLAPYTVIDVDELRDAMEKLIHAEDAQEGFDGS
jgi:hypothetical protein